MRFSGDAKPTEICYENSLLINLNNLKMKNNKNRIKEYKNCDFKIEELEDRLELGAWIGGDGGQGGSNSGDGGDGGDAGDGGDGNIGVKIEKK